MPSFGKRSLGCRAECDPRLQAIADEAIKRIDFGVIVGSRSNADQQIAYEKGLTKLGPGLSPHNQTPSKAFDFIPSPFTDADWKNFDRFKEVAAVLCQVAAELNIPVRWGGTWSNRPAQDAPAHFCDSDHFELHGV